MSESFNGYHVWLGIPPNEQPPNHYRLLGIAAFETDLDVIDHAADRQMSHVRTFQAGRHGALSQQILNELAAARVCLLNPEKKSSYDAQLRSQIGMAASVSSLPLGKPLPVAQPIAIPAAPPVGRAIVKSSIATAGQPVIPVPDQDEAEIEVDLPAVPDLSSIPLERGSSLRTKRASFNRSSSWQRQVGMAIVGIVALASFWLLYHFAHSLASGDLWKLFSMDENTGKKPPSSSSGP